MKVKVLKYKFDGNTVVAPYMEVEPYGESVFISLSKKDEYGNVQEDIFHIICKVEDIYFSCGQSSRRQLEKESCKAEAERYCKKWIDDTLQSAKDGSYVSQLSIRVFEQLGLDTSALVQAREAYLKKKEREAKEAKARREEKRRSQELEWQQRLDEEKRKFLAGEPVTADIFLQMVKRDGFEIHIRTQGTLNRYVSRLQNSGTIHYRKARGCRTPDFSGCHKAIAGYLKFLEKKSNS